MTDNYKPYERRVTRRKRTSDSARKSVDKIMSDGKKRSVDEIISVMWDELEEHNKNNHLTGTRTGRVIPTRSELRHHMGRHSSEKYESAEFDILTGSRRTKRTNNTEKKYWCKI